MAYDQLSMGMNSQQGRNPFLSFLTGSPAQRGNQSRYSPQIQSNLDSVLSQFLGNLGGGQFDFAPIENKARSDYAQKTLPSIQERLTSFGAGGGRSSGGQQILNRGAVDLETNLAAMRQGYGLQQQQLMQQLLGLGQQDPYYQPRTPSIWESLLGQLGSFGGQAAGGYLGGPAFAMKQNPEFFNAMARNRELPITQQLSQGPY